MRRFDVRRAVSLLLCGALLCGLCAGFPGQSAAAVNKTVLIAQAQRLAVSNSKDITKQANAITLKKIKYVEAVAGIKAKVKNLRSFRWTPLLSFKFPEKLNLTEEYELNIKPLTLQSEITTMQHKLDDLRYAVLEEVNKAYLSAYVLQEKVNFTDAKLTLAQQELARNEARLLVGDATQSDIDKMTKSIDTLTNELSSLKRKFENAKSELTDLIKLDVTSGYTLRNPMFTARIPREVLEELTTYTLDHDQLYYETKMALSTARLNVDAYEGLMRNQYGGKMNIIMPYVNAALAGQDVDYGEFQLKYREMLKTLDRPWAGYLKILFFKFTMEWFKGEISGTRYIEDEMYAIYSACMEYGAALTEKEATEKSLRKQVSTSYENIVTAGNSYADLAQATADTQEDYERVLALNKIGKADYEEVSDKQAEYQDMQMETLDALASYNELLFTFDRLTCGAVSKYFAGEDLGQGAGGLGDSYAEISSIDGPYYYLTNAVEDLVFTFGVEIPEDYEPAISRFEIWYENTQLGTRTDVGKEIRHLMLDYGDTSMLTVKLFDGDKYVGECEIDTTVPRDRLELAVEVQAEPATEEQIGTYKISSSPIGEINISSISLTINASVGAKSYTLSDANGKNILSDEIKPLSDSFSYMTLLATSLEDVTLTLYDGADETLRTARFHTDDQTIWSPVLA